LNVFSKILTKQIDPVMVAFWRNAIALPILVVAMIAFRQTHLMKTSRPVGQIIRAVLGTIGLVMAAWTFDLMPITEGVVLSFSSPFFVILLSYPLLKEKVGIYRILATCVGLIGVVVMIGFDQSVLTPKGIAVGLGFAFFNGLVLVMLRQLGKTEHSLTTVFYFLVIWLLITTPYLPFAGTIIPDPSYWWVIIALGVVGVSSLILKTESFRHAPASVIAPVAYTILIWSCILDFLIWNHVASSTIWIGAGIIILSNLFILWREHKISKTGESHPA
jgi:drug/metabolite transporter (DMT)-like permease